MAELTKNKVDKAKIEKQIAELSTLLGMIPSDDSIALHEPGTQNSMKLSRWLSHTRNSFLKLSVLLGQSLGLTLP